jgi:autotransporter-associated beta strand protein
MKGTKIQITAALLAGLAFLGVASANAQEVTLLRSVNVNETVPDRGQYVSVSLLDLANSGMASITDVNVNLSLSSLNQNNPMWLGQVYASLTYGVASEGVRTATLLNRPGVSDSNSFGSSLSSLNVTFDDSAAANIFSVATGTGTYQADGRLGVNPYASGVAYNSGNINAGLSALNGGLLQSNKWSLLVADTQQGAVAKLDSWGVRVTGTAANSGLLNLGAGGSVATTATGTEVQSVEATVVSSSSGSGAVGLLAMVNNKTLNLSGGLKGSGEFNKTGSGTMRVGNSAEFTGTLNVNDGKVVVDGALAAGSRTVVGSGGLLGGSGTLGALTLQRGATLTPGNSPGLLTAASAVWGAGATYEWQLGSLTGAAGTDWDLFRVTGTLDMRGLSSSDKFNLNLVSISNGPLDLSAGYEWTFVQAANFTGLSSLALGTDITNLFQIATQGMDVGTDPANIKVLVGDRSNGLTSLNVWAVPEPSSQSLLAFGMAALVAVRSMRRKQS